MKLSCLLSLALVSTLGSAKIHHHFQNESSVSSNSVTYVAAIEMGYPVRASSYGDVNWQA